MVMDSQIRTLCGLAILSVAIGVVPAAAQVSTTQQASADRQISRWAPEPGKFLDLSYYDRALKHASSR